MILQLVISAYVNCAVQKTLCTEDCFAYYRPFVNCIDHIIFPFGKNILNCVCFVGEADHSNALGQSAVFPTLRDMS